MKFPIVSKTEMARRAWIHRNYFSKFERWIRKTLKARPKEQARAYLLEMIEELKKYIDIYLT